MKRDRWALLSYRARQFFDAQFRHLARNSIWSLATTAVVAGVLLAETVLLARHLGPISFGVYVLVIAYPEAVQLLLDFRTRETMTRYLGGFLARDEKERAVAVVKLLWLIDFGVALSAFLIVFATAPIVAPHVTDDPETVRLMQIYAFAILFGGLDATAGSVLRVLDRFRLSFLTGAGAMVFRLVLIVVLIAGGSELEGLIWARVAGELAATLVLGSAAFVLLKRLLWAQRRTGFSALTGLHKEVFHFLLHMNLQGSVRAAAAKLDVIVVGAMAGPGTAGVYKVGVQFGSSLLLFADPLFSAVYPLFSRARALGNEREIRVIGRTMSVVVGAVVIPTALVLAAASGTILGALVGPAFAEAAPPMVIVLAGVVPAVVFFWGRPAMLALGDAGIATTIVSVAIAVQFTLLFVLVGRYGASGAAIGFAAMSLVTVALTLRYLRERSLL